MPYMVITLNGKKLPCMVNYRALPRAHSSCRAKACLININCYTVLFVIDILV